MAARLGDAPATYALEGSVAVAGSLIGWLRDNLGIIGDASEVEALARSVPDSGDVVFVPAFSGLFAPHWRSDARGIIAGLTAYASRGNIARAALESTAYQVYDLGVAMVADLGAALPGELRVDGGMIRNELLMQFQADILDRPVVAAADRRDERPGRGLRRRTRRRVLGRARRAARDGPRRATLGAGDGRGDSLSRDRPLAQGRRADARLGRSDGLSPDDRPAERPLEQRTVEAPALSSTVAPCRHRWA